MNVTAAAAANCNDSGRTPLLSLSDFQHLVTTAFDLHPDSPAARSSPNPRPQLAPPQFSLTRSRSPMSRSLAPQSAPLSDSTHIDIRTHSFLPHDRFHDRSRTPFNIFRALKSRASTLLRPSVSDLTATHVHISSSSTPRPSTARPSLSSQRTLQPFAPAAFAPSHHPTPSHPSSPRIPRHPQLNTSLSRVRSRSLPRSFLKMSGRTARPTNAPPPTHVAPLESFFDASSLGGKQSFPPYARPPAPSNLQIHTHLPPLRKSKSFAPSLFSRKLKRPTSKFSNRSILPRAQSSYGLRFSGSDQIPVLEDPRCPSPFTCPREPPAPPSAAADMLKIPDYVFQRRGSATSSSTLSSTKTSSTFSDRVSSAFSVPISLSFLSKSKSHSRSKLHLSIPSSPQSSPSTQSSGTTTSPPVTPLSPNFSFNGVSSFSFSSSSEYAGSLRIDPNASRTSLLYVETEEEALAIGRVLTPEPDPFAKPEIELDWDMQRDGTPRPMSAQSNRRASGMRRKRGSASSYGADTTMVDIPENLTDYPDFSVAYSLPSSCSIHGANISHSSHTHIQTTKMTPPSPTRGNRAVHPPSAWTPPCSPLIKAGMELSDSVPQSATETDVLKDLPPRPPSRPLPGLPPTAAADVFGDEDALTSTPRRIGRLRRERRSINSFVAACGSPRRNASQADLHAESEADGAHAARPPAGKSVSDRPPSPFPLVRELSGGRRTAKESAHTTGIDDSGIEMSEFGEERMGHSNTVNIHNARYATEIVEDPVALANFSTTPRSDTPIPGSMEQLGEDISVSAFPSSSFLSHEDDADGDDWDNDTSRSTAFFSARSSMSSSDPADPSDTTDEDTVSSSMLADLSLRFPYTPEYEFHQGKSYF